MPMFGTSIDKILTRWNDDAVPDEVDDDYITHVNIGLGPFREQEEEEEAPPEELGEVPEDPGAEPEDNPMEDPGADPMADPAAGGDMEGGMDASMDPMGGEDKGPQSPEEVGRVYELKKIHSRLVSIESHLSGCSSEELVELRGFVSRALELFDSLISNVDLYKDKLPDIIVTYYKFLDAVFLKLKKHYKEKAKKEDN